MDKVKIGKSFHLLTDADLSFQKHIPIHVLGMKQVITQERDVDYRVYSHFHPYVGQLVQRLISASTAGLQAADTDYVKKSDGSYDTLADGKLKPVLYADYFASTYSPSNLVKTPYPVKDLDFTYSGAYSGYNWELFFHVPLTIAIHLSKNQRFAEAQKWFHFLFDPTDDSDGPTPERFWKVRPFQYTDVRKIEEILVNLATGDDPDLRNETIYSIEAWKDAPFRPHIVARYRQQAYMYKTVMAYLDNLIAWGDSLFRQDTGEAIDEAMMLYVLTMNILGPRPMAVPKKGTVRPQTYANLRADLRQFGTVLRDMEADAPFDLMPLPAPASSSSERLATIRSLGKALYFGVPRNDKLLGYWDTVADRLFKIRNSLNLQGIFRQLALFEPPIDPALLAAAAAAGLDIGAVVSGVHQPLPLVRFQLLVHKASEICQEVKSLGNGLLHAMEKEDAEALAILRAKHERTVMEMVEHIRYAALQEAIKSKEALLQSLASAVQRYTHYEQQLGKSLEEIQKSIPELNELDTEGLLKGKFSMTEPEITLRPFTPDIASDLGGSGGKIVNSWEALELKKLADAQEDRDRIHMIHLGGQAIAMLPMFGINFHFWGLGGKMVTGGLHLGKIAQFAASVMAATADRKSYEAVNAERIARHARRADDWTHHSNASASEITQIFKQLRAAQIREAIADQDLKVHKKHMEHAEEVERFLNEEGNQKKGKSTNKALYTWMKREARGLYSQCFQVAYDVAKKAERALQHELGATQSYLQYTYLGGKEGLLAGEKLHLDIKRMEMGFHEQNRREYELTKHISLLQIDPMALLELRTTGRCTVKIPEEVFDMDGPGHYFRRIRSVALSIPCVTGPYASVNCTLTLLKSSIRTTQNVGEQYERLSSEDSRFSDYFGSTQSIVTSSAQNDSGMFETNLRDERFLPFELSGAISEWQLELPSEVRQFDYSTISDVILHMRYTARAGGGLLKTGAIKHLTETIRSASNAVNVRLFSMRHEFPSEWARFKAQPPSPDSRYELSINIRDAHYPYWSQPHLSSVKMIRVVAQSAKLPVPSTLEIFQSDGDDSKKDALMRDAAHGDLLVGSFSQIALPESPTGDLKIYVGDRDLDDLWVAVTWGGEE